MKIIAAEKKQREQQRSKTDDKQRRWGGDMKYKMEGVRHKRFLRVRTLNMRLKGKGLVRGFFRGDFAPYLSSTSPSSSGL